MTASDEVAVRMIDSAGVWPGEDESAALRAIAVSVVACADRLILSGNVVDADNGLDVGNAVDSGCGLEAGTALDTGGAGETGNVAAVSFLPGSVAVLSDRGALSVRVRQTIADACGLSRATRISEVTARCCPADVDRVSGAGETVLRSAAVEFLTGSTATRGEMVCRGNDSLVCIDSR